MLQTIIIIFYCNVSQFGYRRYPFSYNYYTAVEYQTLPTYKMVPASCSYHIRYVFSAPCPNVRATIILIIILISYFIVPIQKLTRPGEHARMRKEAVSYTGNIQSKVNVLQVQLVTNHIIVLFKYQTNRGFYFLPEIHNLI